MSDCNLPNPYAETFINPKGPGDARPTALQIVRDNDLLNKWTGNVALVTGATSGIGLETARALHATGADVFITGRDLSKAKITVDDILKSTEGSGKLEIIEMDFNSLDSVKKGVKEFLAKSNKLNILVNNAGVMATPEGSKTTDGFEQQFGVNYLAHFVLNSLLLPTLISSSTPNFNSRIVGVASNGHRFSTVHLDDVNLTRGYNPWVGYGNSKTALIWMMNYINRVYGPQGVRATSLHPGGIWTGLQTNMDPAMLEHWKADPLFSANFLSTAQGAATTLWAAVSKEWEGKGGKYLYACTVADAAKDNTKVEVEDPGYAPHAFDVEEENKLWELSTKLTGVSVSI